jgi:NAD(P)-dependent dehydrogenase (short-subunit alcohol dehydrogenase family)
MYGLAKMFADAYMTSLGKKKQNSNILINSCDPGLVYTELILKMPKYEGKSIQESGAQTPAQGVEAAMRLLFDKDVHGSGHFYAMNRAKDRLLKSTINVKPAE